MTWGCIVTWTREAVVSVFLCGQNQRQDYFRNHGPGSEPEPKAKGRRELSKRKWEQKIPPLVSGRRAVRGADCPSFGAERRRKEELWTGYWSLYLLLLSSGLHFSDTCSLSFHLFSLSTSPIRYFLLKFSIPHSRMHFPFCFKTPLPLINSLASRSFRSNHHISLLSPFG